MFYMPIVTMRNLHREKNAEVVSETDCFNPHANA